MFSASVKKIKQNYMTFVVYFYKMTMKRHNYVKIPCLMHKLSGRN